MVGVRRFAVAVVSVVCVFLCSTWTMRPLQPRSWTVVGSSRPPRW